MTGNERKRKGPRGNERRREKTRGKIRQMCSEQEGQGAAKTCAAKRSVRFVQLLLPGSFFWTHFMLGPLASKRHNGMSFAMARPVRDAKTASRNIGQGRWRGRSVDGDTLNFNSWDRGGGSVVLS